MSEAGAGARPGERDAVVLESRGLTKRFGETLAVDHVDLALRRGEILGLVGKNGAGKSTLIRMLAGVVRPDEGSIGIGGEAVEFKAPVDAHRRGIAFVPQELSCVPGLSVAENVELGQRFPTRMGTLVRWHELQARTRDVLDRLQAGDIDPTSPVERLSLVQQRLVMIARGLAGDMRVLILDEPTASLTPTEIDHLHGVARALCDDGISVVYVTHRLDEIDALTQRVAVMRDGMLVAEAPTQAMPRPQLVATITGAASGETVPPGAADSRAEAVGGELLRVADLARSTTGEPVDVTVSAGEVVGIAGMVGAGRTELARAIVGLDRHAQATIHVDGRPVVIRSPRDAIRAGIVLVPEDRHAQGNVLDFSVRENVTLSTLSRYRIVAALPFSRRSREARAARSVMQSLDLRADDEEQVVGTLSGGNQQKVILGRWLLREPRIFILDEPTNGIDIAAKREIYALIASLCVQGKGVLLVSSEFAELAEICDRVLVMREGRIVDELQGERITEAAMVASCYAETTSATTQEAGA